LPDAALPPLGDDEDDDPEPPDELLEPHATTARTSAGTTTSSSHPADRWPAVVLRNPDMLCSPSGRSRSMNRAIDSVNV
jgi:hypothetical protein